MMKRGLVPTEPYTIPLGKAAIRRAGDDVTIISYGRLMYDVLKAAEELAGDGISAEVIDLRTLAPLDMETVLASVAKTRRARWSSTRPFARAARRPRSPRGSTRSCTAS